MSGDGDQGSEAKGPKAKKDEPNPAGSVGDMAGGLADAVGGVSDLLGDGADTKEAREGLEVAEGVIDGVKDAAKTADAAGKALGAISKGDVGGAAGGIGNALGSAGSGVGELTGAVGGMAPEEAKQGLKDASRVANTVGTIARGAGQLVDGASDLLDGLGDLIGGGRQSVDFELEIAGADAQFTVRDVNMHEGLGALYEGWIEATFDANTALDEQELLSKDVTLGIERGEERRHFRGIIRRASVRRAQEHQVLQLDVAPALWLADETLDSRVYQDVSVPDLVEQVITELLGDRQRKVKRELTETYEPHEYLVQHRESHFQFLDRLMREEGIFFYFDHDEDDSEHEVLVMGDSNSNRPLVRAAHDGVIEFEEEENRREGREVAFAVHSEQRVGASDAVVRGFDWTNPNLNVENEQKDRANWSGPRLEVYDHNHSVRHHGYDEGGGSYKSHTADRRARIEAERLDLSRKRWNVSTTVVTAQPGHTFDLQGADLHDGRYMIVSMTSTGSGGEDGGTYTNSLRVIPTSMPYHPPAVERRLMPGPETATVVGPDGEEIHTDKHGRIKVQFHWDRQGQRNEKSSAWMRVAQNWAGAGWGFVFIPRIGMEVIVSFLGGDPDRPIVTGCVYNGDHPLPLDLPDEKTKSTIKTNSSLGGGGSNEIRFEDKKGKEEVYIHAEKDFNEVVENNHTTRVKNCQTNTVDVDQTETIGNDQSMTVKNDRKKFVDGTETTIVGGGEAPGNRIETVVGDEHVGINQNRTHVVRLDESLTVEEGKRTVTVQTGKNDETYSGGRNTEVSEFDNLRVIGGANRNVTVSGQYNIVANGAHYKVKQGGTEEFIQASEKTYIKSASEVQLKASPSHLVMDSDGNITLKTGTKIAFECGSAKLELNADGTILIEGTSVQVKGGDSLVKLEAAGATLKGPKADVLADMFCTIKGTLVRIN